MKLIKSKILLLKREVNTTVYYFTETSSQKVLSFKNKQIFSTSMGSRLISFLEIYGKMPNKDLVAFQLSGIAMLMPPLRLLTQIKKTRRLLNKTQTSHFQILTYKRLIKVSFSNKKYFVEL